MRAFHCRETGRRACGFVAWGRDVPAALRQAKEHLASVHGVAKPTPAQRKRLRAAVHAA